MAGFHTLQHPAPGSLLERVYKPLLQPGLHKIIGFAERTQELMVASGNPLQLHSLRDVSTHRARFINRALGTGTRVVIDELLAQQGLTGTDFNGFEHTEPSHTAVAHAIAAGAADVGVGIEAAARAQGLDFVPLVQENYHLVCLKSALDDPAIVALRGVLHNAEWQQRLATIVGHSPAHCGEVLSLRSVLPWWSFPRQKVRTQPKTQ
jgi:molybdate-binding protein